MAVAGFIGLGNIGGPMAERLLGNPDGLIVHDVRPEAAEALVAKGAHWAETAREVARRADVVSLVVRDDEQVREVTGELLAEPNRGQVIAIHSTIRAATAEELAARAAARGVHVLDAAISGGAMGAAAGTLAVMVGGPAEAVALATPVFSQFASKISHLGPVGAGTRAKLARNLMHFVAFAAAGEASRLAAAAGIDVAELGAIVRHSDAVTGGPGAIMLRGGVDTLSPGDDWYPVMRNVESLGRKDLSQALELAGELGVETPLARLARERLAFELGLPQEGT